VEEVCHILYGTIAKRDTTIIAVDTYKPCKNIIQAAHAPEHG